MHFNGHVLIYIINVKHYLYEHVYIIFLSGRFYVLEHFYFEQENIFGHRRFNLGRGGDIFVTEPKDYR